MRWTDERVQEVSRMLGERYSASQIAAQMGVTRNAVIGIAHRRGLIFLRIQGAHVLRPDHPKRTYRPRAPRTLRSVPTRPSPPIVTEIDLRQAEVEARHVSLIDLQDGECKYPYGEGPFTFCALPANSCYCPAHFALTRNSAPRGYERRRRYSRWGTLIQLEVVA